jgi:hypothetical protein
MKKFQNLVKNEEISKLASYQKQRNFKIWSKMKKFQNLPPTKNKEISKFGQK